MVKIKVLLCAIFIGLSGTAWAQKQIVCATIAHWPPMEYLDEQGKIIGYTADLMKVAGRIAGFTIEFREVAEADIVASLVAGEYDAICSSMINEALRRQELDFSEPYFLARQMLVVHEKKVLVASRNWTGMRFGARKGSYGMETAHAIKDVTSREYDSIARAMEDVYVYNLEGVLCDDPVARYYAHVKYKKGLKLTGYLTHSPKKPLSVAVAKGNTEILELLNRGISTVKARRIDQELQLKWFSR